MAGIGGRYGCVGLAQPVRINKDRSWNYATSPQTTPHHQLPFTKVHSFLAKMTNDEPLNPHPKSHEVLRQTGFETTFRSRCRRSQSGAQSKKPRVVRGLRLPQGLLSRFEVFVLAEREGFEPSVPLTVRLISSQVHSTTLPPLRTKRLL